MKMSGIRAKKTAARRAKVEKVWMAFLERDLSFSYSDFLRVFIEMFGKTGAPSKHQMKSDIMSFAGYVDVMQSPVAGSDFRNDHNWVGRLQETIYFHRPFNPIGLEEE